jgi:chitinase
MIAIPGTHLPVTEPDDDEPRREFSVPRVVLALLVTAGVIGATGATVARTMNAAEPSAPAAATWFAPYVDTTLTPLMQFQDPGLNPSRQAALGFVVADPKEACTPSWGGAYGLAAAATGLDLDQRVAQVRVAGGEVLVSFGGAANSELAHSCADPAKLAAAYGAVISRYGVKVADFDLEGDTLADAAATARRATVLAGLQRSATAAGRELAVWLTLPVGRDGLTGAGLAAVSTTLAAGVDLAGVNVMAMDFGGPEPDMGAAVHSSLVAAHDQLAPVYRARGVADDSTGVWNHMGATVMIGQNDTAGEVFTTADAKRLVREAGDRQLGRVSAWSLNRDAQCGGSFAVVGMHSNVCSGTPQAGLEFSTIFAGLTGAAVTVADDQARGSMGAPAPSVVDDPATSPYPVWQPTRRYVGGYKVVRERNVYQAKWFTQGQDPATRTLEAIQTPWQLLGPVLAGDHPPALKTLPRGTYPAWSPTGTYAMGEKVLYDRLPYEARWYNWAVSPGAQDADPASSPWTPLFVFPGEPAGT